MTGIFKILAFILLLLFLTVTLREMGFRGTKLFSVLGCLLILVFLIDGMGRVVKSLDKISAFGKAAKFTQEALKIVGVGYVFGTVSDICTDMGESGISNVVLSIGRVEILILSLPYVEEIFSLASSLLKS